MIPSAKHQKWLQDAKVLADDRWQIVRILSIFNHYDKGNARCLIEINRL